MKKSVISFFFTVLLSVSLLGVASAETQNAETKSISFKDISGHWAEPQIKQAVAAGYVTGYADGTFKPDATVTGEEFLTMLVKALQYSTEPPRSDESWFEPYKQAAINHEIYKDDYLSGLDKPITRKEIASTIARAVVQPEYEKSLQEKMSSIFSPATLAIKYPEYEADKKMIESNPDFKDDLSLIQQNPEIILSELEQALSATKIRNPAKYVTDYNQCTADYSCGIAGAHFCPNANQCYYRVSLEQESLERFLKYFHSGVDWIIRQKQNQTATPNRMVYEAAYRGLMTGTSNGELSLDSKVTRAQAVTFVNRVRAYNSGERFETDKHTVGEAEVIWHKTNIMTMLPRYFTNPEHNWNELPEELNYQAMESVSDNGNLVCETEKFVVIDLDDLNDPNRNLLTDDLRWGKFPNFYTFDGVSAYAIISVNKLTIKGPISDARMLSCNTSIINSDWQDSYQNSTSIDTKSPKSLYSIVPWNSVSNEPQIGSFVLPKVAENNQFITIFGYILPKHGIDSKKTFSVNFTTHGYDVGGYFDTERIPLYYSLLNENYPQ